MNALLIGINYTGTVNQLQGCIFDVIQMKSLIIDAYGFNPNTIVVLRDDDPANRPTKHRILQELARLVAQSDLSSNTFLHYSGHGTQIADTVDEADRLDECIVPCDYATAGFITDDEINAICKPLKGTGLAIFDCCRSGTIMDLPFSLGVPNDSNQQQGFYCFSGSTDSQDVQEGMTSTTGSNTGLPQGAMTMTFISTVRALKYYPPIVTLCRAIQSNLRSGGYQQTPQLSSTVPIYTSTPFPFETPVTKLYQALIQLEQQTSANAVLQNQIPALQAHIAALQQQASTIPTLEASSNTLCVIQQQNAALTRQIVTLQQQLEQLPFLQQQAALVPKLKNQNAMIPALQTQLAGYMRQKGQIQQLQLQLAGRR
uniref:Peptidase C14 caspase domain-containing protein n=1 Tax=viral metagenome TaxID=1070528 RepID=A0A6C0JZZ6_9ZZZZ